MEGRVQLTEAFIPWRCAALMAGRERCVSETAMLDSNYWFILNAKEENTTSQWKVVVFLDHALESGPFVCLFVCIGAGKEGGGRADALDERGGGFSFPFSSNFVRIFYMRASEMSGCACSSGGRRKQRLQPATRTAGSWEHGPTRAAGRSLPSILRISHHEEHGVTHGHMMVRRSHRDVWFDFYFILIWWSQTSEDDPMSFSIFDRSI